MILLPGLSVLLPMTVGSVMVLASELVTDKRSVSSVSDASLGHCSMRYVSSTELPLMAIAVSCRICCSNVLSAVR